MRKKMYVLRTWMYDGKEPCEKPYEESIEDLNKQHFHPTELSVYIADEWLNDNAIGKIPYITTDRLDAKKFCTKKEAINYSKRFGGCYVDCVWHFTKGRDPYGRIYDLWG